MSGWRLRNAAMHSASQFSARLIGQEMTTVLLRAEATIASVAWSIWSSAWRSVGRNASPISVSLRLRGIAHEQLAAEIVLQGTDMIGDGRLGVAELLRSQGEAQMPGRALEGTDVVERGGGLILRASAARETAAGPHW